MGHTTLFVRVGRAEAKPVCTVDDYSPTFESQLSAQENKYMSELIAGGNDPARVTFERVSGGDEPSKSVKKGANK